MPRKKKPIKKQGFYQIENKIVLLSGLKNDDRSLSS
jgi:hypothetical protein